MILVDFAREYYAPHLRTNVWAHMASDDSVEELHAFATRLGRHRAFWHKDHYDLTQEGLAEALELGAVQVSTRELARRRVR
jgi:hypothetical protein